MGWLRTLVVCGSALAISGASARAADMPDYSSPFPVPSGDRLPVAERISGWYLRGDIGYRFQLTGTASDFIAQYDTSTLKDTYVLGGGAGYKAQWFRADVTGDYGWRSEYSAATAAGAPSVNAKFDTFTVLANGYIDLGTWGGFTPYVGAGIGGAEISIRDYKSVPPQTTFTPTAAKWNVAWAAMVGVSYNLSYNVLIDVGYRHVNMGDAVGGPSKKELTVRKVTGDEIRVGIRYLID
jgi:opacity protein-like surface antigen